MPYDGRPPDDDTEGQVGLVDQCRYAAGLETVESVCCERRVTRCRVSVAHWGAVPGLCVCGGRSGHSDLSMSANPVDLARRRVGRVHILIIYVRSSVGDVL